ncbi:MAG: hypothetical protein ACK2U9_24550, partial [Anaerolineae bacterium]
MLLNPEAEIDLRQSTQLKPDQIEALVRLARQEEEQLLALETTLDAILADAILAHPHLTQADKVDRIAAMGYNERIFEILTENQDRLRSWLGADRYRQFVSWLEERWRAETTTGESASHLDVASIFPGALALQRQYPRSFEVWATRYDSGGRYVVALPDKCLKFANAGAMLCNAGYQYNQNYSVAISYKGKIVVAPVLESGPWNIDDNYWSTLSDPQPRRMFTDLPLGIPAAQAAYYNGYNGGLDQFGRLVKSPVAIDISWAVSEDLNLPPGNTKVTVSFLWTEGWSLPGDTAEGSAANSDDGDVPVYAPSISWSTCS